MLGVNSRSRCTAIVLALIALMAIPRLVGSNLFATVDEPFWLTAGSDFYYALGQRAFANTVYDYHPAVTTMWIVATALLVYFPQYRGLGQGYFDVYKDSLERFLLSHGHTPLGLLTTARILQAALIVLLLLVLFWLLRRLLSDSVAVVGILLISFDPFFLGHSRLLNHEGMLALFTLISLCAFLAYLLLERRLTDLILSGAMSGMAQLTKSSSIVIVPLIGALFLVDIILRRGVGWKKQLGATLGAIALWLLALGIVYVGLWPGMWVAPGEMLYQVFGNAFSYAFEGSRLAVAGGQPAGFQPHLGDIVLYFQSMLWRTTPVAWIGGLLGLATLFRRGRNRRIVLLSVLVAGALLIVLFGVASGRNSAHYVLTSYVALDILAAAGFVDVVGMLGPWLSEGRRSAAMLLALGGAILIQAGSALTFFPYYYIYYNPIMEALEPGRQNPNFGYGEGLDLAASYLKQKPGAANSTVTAFYGRGPFSYFYPGTTEPLKPVYADAENVPQLEQILHKSDYLVIYYQLEKGRDSPANVMHALEGAVPETIIWLNGIEYVRIYHMQTLGPGFYDALMQ